MYSFLSHFILIVCCLPIGLHAQINDCRGAQVVCSSEDIVLNPQGPGVDDFANPNNDPGCMVAFENHTAWFYFEINDNAPSGLSLGFTINPHGGLGEDYDWVIYGPNVSCNNLGSPVRCSSSSALCDFCPQTGMGMGTTDITEGPGSGDGFVMPLQVEPGQGYYLMIDNFYGSQQGFGLTWTDSAADHLNCDAIPCNLIANTGTNIFTCGGERPPIQLQGSVTGGHGNETYSWSGTNGGTDFLSDTNIANPTILLPADFSGTITYTLTVQEDGCISQDIISVIVDLPEVAIIPSGPYCASAAAVSLLASPPGGTWGGTVNGNVFDPVHVGPGVHTVTYTVSSPPCINTSSIDIEVLPASGITIDVGDNLELELGEAGTVEALTNFSFDQIDTVIWSPDSIVECLDPLCLMVSITSLHGASVRATVYDITGCSSFDDLQISVSKNRKVYIPSVFSPNDDGINDVFYISGNGKQIARIKKLTIYNRWGAVVHESVDLLPDDDSQGWNGHDEKYTLNPGVYVYAIEIAFVDGGTGKYTGDLTVLR